MSSIARQTPTLFTDAVGDTAVTDKYLRQGNIAVELSMKLRSMCLGLAAPTLVAPPIRTGELQRCNRRLWEGRQVARCAVCVRSHVHRRRTPRNYHL